jgi:CHASE2 domain-containing sensor protein
MEVVLLWLDDLDDAFFLAALEWEHLRRGVLRVGLAASLALAASELAAIATQWAPVFSGVAAASVAAWFLGAALRMLYYRESRGSPSAA